LGVPILEGRIGGLYASIFPAANWRQGRIYASIPNAALTMKEHLAINWLIFLYFWLKSSAFIDFSQN